VTNHYFYVFYLCVQSVCSPRLEVQRPTPSDRPMLSEGRVLSTGENDQEGRKLQAPSATPG
jgi:hypothetical protein